MCLMVGYHIGDLLVRIYQILQNQPVGYHIGDLLDLHYLN